MTTRTARIVSALWLATALLAAAPAQAERIKDIASIAGVRANQLVGYGVVVGLDGSGDQTTQTPFTVQSIISMLSAMGINMPPGQSLQLKNVAAVMVTASLPAFARAGQNIDITVPSLFDRDVTRPSSMSTAREWYRTAEKLPGMLPKRTDGPVTAISSSLPCFTVAARTTGYPRE